MSLSAEDKSCAKTKFKGPIGVYKFVAIPIAAMGLLNPMWGAFFMAFSDIVVIGNSLRLKHKKIQ